MNIKVILLFLILLTPLVGKEKIAVCIPAREASEASIQSLIESGRRHFCRLHDVQYFILSDEPCSLEGDDIEWLSVESGKAFKLFQSLQGNKKLLEAYNYLFIIDPKMIFVAPVGNEVFGDLIAVQKVNSTSKKPIFSSGFYGGRPASVFDLLKYGCKHVDYANSHPEEHITDEIVINRCFKEKPPVRILNPSYAYPENWELEYSKKIIESRG